MASAEQPLKKRKLYEQLSEPSPPPPPPPSQPPPPQPPPPQPSQGLQQSFVSPSLSQEEILRRRRNREEIRNLYDCYKRIKFCVSQKDDRLMPEVEQAYLSLITASRGCTSVQRIVADLIPRYASFCPTALEAAAKVTINMHNWSLGLINRGEDADGVAFETAKACIFGLADICHIASLEAHTSSVIRGICSAVFFNVLTFFVSSLEGKGISQVVDKDMLKLEDSPEIFSELKQKFSDVDESALLKLFKFRVLSILRIFFCCPKSLLAACFELIGSTATEGINEEGLYFLSQISSRLDADEIAYPLNHTRDGPKQSAGSVKTSNEGNEVITEGLPSQGSHVSKDASLVRNCLLGLVISKDHALKSWVLSKYNKLCVSASSQAASEIKSVLEGVLKSFTELAKLDDDKVDSEEDDSDPSIYSSGQYLVPRILSPHETSCEVSGVESALTAHDESSNNDLIDKYSGQNLKPHSSVVPLETDFHSNTSSNHDSGASKSMDFETVEQGDLPCSRSLTPRDLLNNQLVSPLTRKPVDLRAAAFEGRNYFGQVERNQVTSMDRGLPALRSSSGGLNNAFESPKHHLAVTHSTTSPVIWYSDGDPAAMEIFSASKQLWLGSLGPEASEALVKIQFEKFGPIDQFSFYPFKGFALVEYKNIMDALRAREVMRRHSPWGACRIKFLDIGLGTRGVLNGVAVGNSCLVYVGNISSQWAKDDIMHEVMKVAHKGPRMITDLTTEGALLMEFVSPEEAAAVMAHLRQHRRGNSSHHANRMRHVDGTVPGTASVHVDFKCNNLGANIAGSPHAQTVVDSPAEIYRKRMTHLSSLLLSLRTKYNIAHNSSYHASSMREDDRLPTSALWINVPSISPPLLSDDELMAICNLAIGSAGSVVRMTRTNVHTGSCWYVECNNLDAANTLLKSLRSCPGIFFQIEFSQPGKHTSAATPSIMKSESSVELVSPRINPETHGTTIRSSHTFQPNWNSFSLTETPEVGGRKIDAYENNMAVNPSQGGSHVVSGATEQMWMYKKPETELLLAPGSMLCGPTPTQAPTIPPPQPFQPSSFSRPMFFPPSSSWDARGLNHQLALNPVSPGVLLNSLSGNAVTPPFLPASVTPLAQIQGSSMQHFDHTTSVPVLPPPLASLPPQPSMPLPLPPSPPPLPQCQPPMVPPPPSSPPPPLLLESSISGSVGQSLQYQWQGALCKSGVHYCTVYAHRVDSDICKYSNAISEPAEWPAKLDMTKRTDFRHVKSTFSASPPHKREVCQLLPSSAGDQKGFQDFISYLKQRECAGVIKIPAVKSLWSRLLFILPYSVNTCSMLSIVPNSSDCLIALVLPKETNFEWI